MTFDIGISQKKREEIAAGLARVLADSYTLYLKTHNYHWNVTGPLFQMLHEMFDSQYRELAEAVDTIAERIRSLGVFAPGSYAQFKSLTSIAEETGVPKAQMMIKNLMLGHETVAKTARSTIPLAESANDAVSVDLLTQRMQHHEKTAWMLRSMLEE